MMSVRGCSCLRLRNERAWKQWERRRNKLKRSPRPIVTRRPSARSDRAIFPSSRGTENDNKSAGDGDETFRTRRSSAVIARMTKTWTVSGIMGLLVLVPVTVCATITYVSHSGDSSSRCDDRSNSNRSNSKQTEFKSIINSCISSRIANWLYHYNRELAARAAYWNTPTRCRKIWRSFSHKFFMDRVQSIVRVVIVSR